MIETRLLHYFLAIAREQNITKAAENPARTSINILQSADDEFGSTARQTAFYSWKT